MCEAVVRSFRETVDTNAPHRDVGRTVSPCLPLAFDDAEPNLGVHRGVRTPPTRPWVDADLPLGAALQTMPECAGENAWPVRKTFRELAEMRWRGMFKPYAGHIAS